MITKLIAQTPLKCQYHRNLQFVRHFEGDRMACKLSDLHVQIVRLHSDCESLSRIRNGDHYVIEYQEFCFCAELR